MSAADKLVGSTRASRRLSLLRRERVSRGLSQWDVASTIGIKQATLSRAETGVPVSDEMAGGIAKFYGMEISELFVDGVARRVFE